MTNWQNKEIQKVLRLSDNKQQTVEPILLSVTETARVLGISPRLLQKLNSSGQLPMPLRLGRRVLWNRAELERWTENCCPGREQWLQIKGDK